MHKVRWNTESDRWQASTDDGKSWEDLAADNENDSSEAIDEAAEKFGLATDQWDIEE